MKEFWRLMRTDPTATALAGAAAFLFLVNAAAIPAFDLPLLRRTAAREERLYALQAELRALRDEAGRVKTAQHLEAEINRLRASFPLRREVVALVGQLSNRATAARLKVAGIDYKPADVPKEGLLQLGIAMRVEGRYADLRRFLADLERMRGRLAIAHLAATGRPGEGEVSARLSLTAYFRFERPPAATAQPAAAVENGS